MTSIHNINIRQRFNISQVRRASNSSLRIISVLHIFSNSTPARIHTLFNHLPFADVRAELHPRYEDKGVGIPPPLAPHLPWHTYTAAHALHARSPPSGLLTSYTANFRSKPSPSRPSLKILQALMSCSCAISVIDALARPCPSIQNHQMGSVY